jgi:DNA-binding CsgD family transcriptional regulator
MVQAGRTFDAGSRPLNTISPSPPRVAEAGTLVGRGAELALVRAFLDRAATSGDALLLFGEPGVGKTHLLDAVADGASSAGAQVLRASGVEFEAELSFSGLNQALLPLLAEFAQLTAAHRDALNVALGFGQGLAPDRLLVCSATLALLRQAATERPLLVIVDDLPWLDRASAGVLGFIARRVAGSRVGLLGASRSGEESFFDRAGLAELEVQPLDDDAASHLVEARFPMLAAGIRKRILVEARGNPLALLELPAALDDTRHNASQSLRATLPLTRQLQALFASRITELPARTRQLLLLMALDGTGDLRVLHTVRGPTLEDLAAAEQTRLAHVDEGTHRPAFRHPLIRSAVVDLSTGEERRRANRVLAELWADQPDRRPWHLAEATVEPDEHVATLLEEAAYRILARGDAVASIAAFTRASELSPLGADRSRRLAEAAYVGADVTGELRSASRLLTEVRRGDPELKRSLQAAVAASALMFNADGDVDTAHRLLVAAIESRLDRDGACDAALEEALHVLMVVCLFGGLAEQWQPFYDALARLTSDVPTVIYLSSKTLADPVRTAAAALNDLDAAIEGLAHEVDSTRIVRIAVAAVYVDRLAGCREALWRVIRAGREGTAIASGINALILLGVDDFWTGQWDEAKQLLDEAVGLYETHGYMLSAWRGRIYQAKLAAARGDYDTALALADQMIQWAVPRRVWAVQRYAWQVQTLAALGRGDFEEAYLRAVNISPAGTLASHVPHALYVLMDVVDAAVHTGRHAEAAAHVAAMREANVAALSSRLALLARGSAAIAAPDDSALERFEEALAIPGIDRWPFDLARVELAYGERLRRMRAMTESRVHLAAALATFERLGARPWADRATNELRATGQTKPRAGQYARVALTPQENEIAMLAAEGLTNKQIGERLFLSHRTVSAHLHRVFPKLGIATRAALRDALACLPQEEHAETRS